jgi:hypothetical protein
MYVYNYFETYILLERIVCLIIETDKVCHAKI